MNFGMSRVAKHLLGTDSPAAARHCVVPIKTVVASSPLGSDISCAVGRFVGAGKEAYLTYLKFFHSTGLRLRGEMTVRDIG